MKSSLLSSYSNFGKYTATNYDSQPRSTTVTSISLKQNYIHQRPFLDCKFDIPGNRIYLLDTKATLLHLNLSDNSFSTLKNEKVKDFTIDGNNSLSLLYVSPQSELYRVSFDTKKPVKIMNLNMSKIIAFQRNYLRQMLLVLDYKLLFLCDLTNPSKIKSLKAGYNETFTNACFASNNRFLILAIKNIQIKILEIVNLKPIHSIRLPFAVQNLRIQVSYDSKKIAIYGNCQIIFFINISDKMQYSYEIIEVPFLKCINQLKYTYQNEIVFLGNDQVLYAIAPTEPTKAIPIFNEDYHVRLMSFDISLDCKKMAVVSNRTVYGFKFSKGLRSAIEQKQTYKSVEYRENGFDKINIEIEQNQQKNEDYQYDDEDESEEEEQSGIQNKTVVNVNSLKTNLSLPIVTDSLDDPLNPLISELPESVIGKKQKVHINKIFNYTISNFRHITLGQSKHFINTIIKLYNWMGKDANKCLILCHSIFNAISMQYQKLQHYGLVLCPQIISIFEKRLQQNFIQFFKRNMAQICSNYYSDAEMIKLINWLVTQLDNSETFPLLFISTLQEVVRLIEEGEQGWQQLLNPERCLVSFVEVINRLQRTRQDIRFRNIFSKKKLSEYGVGGCEVLPPTFIEENKELYENNLQKLIIRQDQIKKALNQIQHQKPVN